MCWLGWTGWHVGRGWQATGEARRWSGCGGHPPRVRELHPADVKEKWPGCA